MKRIQEYIDLLEEEIEGAKDYAERYLDFKAKNDITWANKWKECANDELKHAMFVHDILSKEIDALSKVYTPPEEMTEEWEKEHRKYVEKVAWIKQMLAL